MGNLTAQDFTKKTLVKKRIWQVYVLRCADKTYYTGIAKDIGRRIREHNNGKGARYIVQSRRPAELIYREGGYTVRQAMKREREIKHLSRDRKRAFET